jgi:hypothetical protein
VSEPADARTALLARLIDAAGLFPAQKPMARAIIGRG